MNKRKLIVLLMLFVMIASVGVTAFAAAITEVDTVANGATGGAADSSLQNIMGAIITITRIVAVGVAIVMLLVLAMKYMMAAPGEKAEIKKSAVIYVVGAIVMFAVSGILTIIQQFASKVDKT